jgi:cellulose biosynthesis protein BcsQ
MLVLAAAGKAQTPKLIESTKELYTTGSVQLKGVSSIREINGIVQKGEPYDRVVVIHRGLTDKAGLLKKGFYERYIRRELQSYTEAVTSYKSPSVISTVFVVQSNAVADIVDEEVFSLGTRYKILVKEDTKFTVDFLNKIFTAEIGSIKSNYVDAKKAEAQNETEDVEAADEDADVALDENILGLNDEPRFDEDETPLAEETDGGAGNVFTETPNLFSDDFYNDFEPREPFSFDGGDKKSFADGNEANGGNGKNGGFSDESLQNDENIFSNAPNIFENDVNIFDGDSDSAPQDFTQDEKNSKKFKRGGNKSKQNKSRKGRENQGAENAAAPKFAGSGAGFGDEIYDAGAASASSNAKLTRSEFELLQENLQKSAAGGKTFLFTGVGGAGASVMAYNFANTLAALGMSVLLVDLDTYSRTQSYINQNAYETLHSRADRISALLQALNNPTRILDYASIVDAGLHVISCPLTENELDLTKKLEKNKQLLKFINITRQTYNFIVLDAPQELLSHFAVELLYNSDHLMFTLEANTRGLMKTIIYYGNVADEEAQEVLFAKSRFIINKLCGEKINAFGKDISVKNPAEITKQMDAMKRSITGTDSELSFSGIPIARIIPYLPQADDFWLKEKSLSDTDAGQDIFLRLLSNILRGCLHR